MESSSDPGTRPGQVNWLKARFKTDSLEGGREGDRPCVCLEWNIDGWGKSSLYIVIVQIPRDYISIQMDFE